MSTTTSSESYKLDSAAVTSAIIIVIALFALLLLINRAMGGMDEAKTLLHIVFPIAAIPVYNSLTNRFRAKSTAYEAVDQSQGYRSLFSSAFIISLVVVVLFEFMSLLSGFTAGAIVAQLYNANNPQIVGFIAQMIGLFVTIPMIFLTCVVAGWLLARGRVNRPFRFAAYFIVSLFVLNLADAILAVSDPQSRLILQLNTTADMTKHIAVAALVRPILLSIALLLGFFLKYVWSSVFGGETPASNPASPIAA